MEVKHTSKKKAAILNLLFNYANAVFAIINGLILVPMYLKYFSISTYGSYLSSGNIVAMLGLLEGGTSMVLTQKLSICYAKKDLKTFSGLIGAGLFVSALLTSLLIIISAGLFPFVSQWIKAEPGEYKNLQYAFLLSAAGAGFSITFSNISAVFQSWLKVQVCGMVNLVSVIVGITSTLLGLQLGLGVVSIPLGMLTRSLFGIVVLSFILSRNLLREKYPKLVIKKVDCLELIKSSFPIFGSNIAKSLVTNSQLLIITSFINPAASAVFFITGRIYTVCDLFLAPIGSSIFSSMSQLVGEGDLQKIKFNLIKVFVLFTAFSAFIMASSYALNYAFISLWVGSDKFGGQLLSGLICLTMLFSTRYKFLEFNLYALGVFGKTVLYDLISGVFRIILIFLLIKSIGCNAIPVAELLSTTLLLGYFLNKLIIDRIKMSRSEFVGFVFAGGGVVLATFVFAAIWALYVHWTVRWGTILMQIAAVSTVNLIIIYLFTKEIKELVTKLYFVLVTKSSSISKARK